MQEHHSDPGVFIRSMATRGQLGGVASATLDLALLLDAAGWDFVLIETVGVGQDEIDVARLADVTIVVLVPGQGDDIQAIKAGVMEVADIFAINKADLPGVERLEQEIRFVQSLSDMNRAVSPAPIRRVVATEGQGIEELVSAAISIFEKKGRARDRAAIWTARIRQMLRERLLSAVQDSAIIAQSNRVAHREIDPFAAVENLVRLVLKEKGEQLGIEIDHLGIAVRGLDEALLFWEQQLGMPLQGRETVEAESVHVAMLPAGSTAGCPRIELLEPSDNDSTISKFLEKRGPGLHHVALKVDDLIATMAQLKDAGATLVNEPRTGAGGHQYVFVHPRSTGGVLLELIQR
jgi:LAO/AO transport system kinase